MLFRSMACATSSRQGPAGEKLGAAGIGAFFATVVTVDDVAAPKPAPDPYLLACERLGVDPAATVAVEDSVTGATSAVAAGCRVLYVPSTEGQPDVDGARTHPGLVGVDVATLAALTSGVPVGGPVGQSGA